jgi:hypothetical protein
LLARGIALNCGVRSYEHVSQISWNQYPLYSYFDAVRFLDSVGSPYRWRALLLSCLAVGCTSSTVHESIPSPARTLWTLAIRNSLPRILVNMFLHTCQTKRRPRPQCACQACRVDERVLASVLTQTGTEALCDHRAISSSDGDHGEGRCIPFQ